MRIVDGDHCMQTFDCVASGLREAIKPRVEKMLRRKDSLHDMEKEVERQKSRINGEVERLRHNINSVTDRQVRDFGSHEIHLALITERLI